jgi:hypothetical protein
VSYYRHSSQLGGEIKITTEHLGVPACKREVSRVKATMHPDLEGNFLCKDIASGNERWEQVKTLHDCRETAGSVEAPAELSAQTAII